MATKTTNMATTIEARFAQIHPNSKPAPIYRMRSSSTTSEATPKKVGTPVHGDATSKHADLPEIDPRIMAKMIRKRYGHLLDHDYTTIPTSLGTPSQAKHCGDLKGADHHTNAIEARFGWGTPVFLERERTRSPERRLEGAREWFDYMVERHQQHDKERKCCNPVYRNYPRPGEHKCQGPSAADFEAARKAASLNALVEQSKRDAAEHNKKLAEEERKWADAVAQEAAEHKRKLAEEERKWAALEAAEEKETKTAAAAGEQKKTENIDSTQAAATTTTANQHATAGQRERVTVAEIEEDSELIEDGALENGQVGVPMHILIKLELGED